MTKSSFFKMDRNIFTSDIWGNVVEFRLFIYLIGNARYGNEPNDAYKDKGITIERGQFLRSIRKLREDLEYVENNAVKSYSLSTVNRAIKSLEAQNRIKTENTKLGTLFTIVNYSKYQGLYGLDHDSLEGKRNEEETQMKQRPNNTNKDNKDIIVLKPEQAEFISVLESIEGYPVDYKKDTEYMERLEDRYPELDLIKAVKKFSDYILDNPFKKNANHRSQMNTSFGKYVEWGTCRKDKLKVVGGQEYSNLRW
jgi:hypothetical protein